MDAGLESLRVMLVDDNHHMRAIVSTILAGCGIRHVRELKDGSGALDALRNWSPDVALVDFQMSPMDGLEFTRQLRNDPESGNPYLPVIMMTGHAERGRIIAARDAGVTEFVAKPVTPRSILDRIQAVVLRPRPFVRTESFFGPDRRRRQDPDHMGPWRRSGDQELTAAREAEAAEGAAGRSGA